MSDEQAKRNLSEISHLFLSSIRERQTGGAPRPQRTPPPSSPARAGASMDLTPEEFAQVFGAGEELAAPEPSDEAVRHAPVSVVLGSHLNGKQFDRVKQYARHLASGRKRIGLIEIDASEFRLMCFDGHTGVIDAASEAAPSESYDPRRMAEAIDELGWDVERWLLLCPNPRVPEARALLRDVNQWVLLSTCDHDGVVSCYRTLKGLADPKSDLRPRLSLALLDAAEPDAAERVFGKLAGVCSQFLGWPLDFEGSIAAQVNNVAEHLVMCCRPTRDKGQLGSAPQWQVVADFLVRARSAAPAAEHESHNSPEATPEELAPLAEATDMHTSEPTTPATSPASEPAAAITSAISDDVIELPGDAGEAGIIATVLRHRAGELIECPIAPPMRPSARLAVTRDRRLVLLAACDGHADLRAIGNAYRWLVENRSLVAMAMPQLAIEPQALPHLRLLMDHRDASAETLRPMLEQAHVAVQTYRKIRWGGRTGLLLEAA
jgi:hypothetical protein